MKVFYSRVSSSDGSQNPERQLMNTKNYDYVFNDTCSGSIPLFERPKGQQIKDLLLSNKLELLEVHSIDRLGRNTVDVLQTWALLTESGAKVKCRNPLIQNIDENGKPDKFSELLMSILSVMGQYERNMIKERQREGIAIAKQKGKYSGRRVGTIESKEQLLAKPKSQEILKYINKGYTYDEIRKIIGCSKTTIGKVKRALSH